MKNCFVQFGGEEKKCEIVKENKKSVWVRIPITKREKIFKKFMNGDPSTTIKMQALLGRKPTEDVEMSVDGHGIIKRNKIKHKFREV